MKVMFPQGICCDLACYPVCQGYMTEGCLMFGDKRNFVTMRTALMADRMLVNKLPSEITPVGMWKKNARVLLDKNMGAPVYRDEKIH